LRIRTILMIQFKKEKPYLLKIKKKKKKKVNFLIISLLSDMRKKEEMNLIYQ